PARGGPAPRPMGGGVPRTPPAARACALATGSRDPAPAPCDSRRALAPRRRLRAAGPCPPALQGGNTVRARAPPLTPATPQEPPVTERRDGCDRRSSTDAPGAFGGDSRSTPRESRRRAGRPRG